MARQKRRTASWALRARQQQIVTCGMGPRQALFVGQVIGIAAAHHFRQAVNPDVQEAAYEKADECGAAGSLPDMRGKGEIPGRCGRHQTIAPSWKIGRYMAMTSVPTKPPNATMMTGSMMEDSVPNAWLNSVS